MKRHGLTEQRIAHICEMMRRLEWQRGKSGPVLAREWGISDDRVKDLAAEASKRVRAEVLDVDVVAETVGCALDRVIREAIADGDRRSAIDACRWFAQIFGAVAPARSLVRHEGVPLAEILAARAAMGANTSPAPNATPSTSETTDAECLPPGVRGLLEGS